MKKKVILTVDDNAVSCRLIERFFSRAYDVMKTYSGYEALQILKEKTVDLILLDVDMPKMNGFEVMERLKLDTKTAGIPVIFLTGLEDKNEELRGLRMGAVDYIQKPFYPEILMQRIESAIKQSESQKNLYDFVQMKIEEVENFRRLAYLDPLTELWNRHYFENQVDIYLQERNPSGYFLILDVDNFKNINDKYGHIEGDKVLMELAEILRRAETGSVLTARLAGDEFVLFIKDIDDESYAKIVADSVLMEIASISGKHQMHVTASIGIARVTTMDKSFVQLYGKADKALYQAKESGKGIYHVA